MHMYVYEPKSKGGVPLTPRKKLQIHQILIKKKLKCFSFLERNQVEVFTILKIPAIETKIAKNSKKYKASVEGTKPIIHTALISLNL